MYQGTPFRSQGMPVLNLKPRTPRPADVERGRLELLSQLNTEHRSRHPEELELDARIASFELAARMQLSATDALDLSQETPRTQTLYGLDNAVTRSYGSRCLMARRLVERGVRFVQIFMAGQPWDTHANNAAGTRSCCEGTDLPIAGLLTDLQQRGLLEETLVFWGGEFGRTPAPGKGRPRPPPIRIFRLACRRRDRRRPNLRRYGRFRLPRRRRPLPCLRPPRDDPPVAGPRCSTSRSRTKAATSVSSMSTPPRSLRG